MIPRGGENGVECVNYKALDSEENSVSFGEEGLLFTVDGGRKDRQYDGDRLWLYPGAPHQGKVSQGTSSPLFLELWRKSCFWSAVWPFPL